MTQNLGIFEDALENVARELGAHPRTDYQALRRALTGWSMSQADWQAIVARLTSEPALGKPAIYDDRKRRIASVLVWTDITQGEHIFAPLVLEEKQHGRSDLCLAATAILHRTAPRNARLRSALSDYGQRLTASITSGGSVSYPDVSSWEAWPTGRGVLIDSATASARGDQP
jgi:hypothetical protein